MTQFLNDTFTDTDGTALTSHVGETGASWTKIGTGTTPVISANAAKKTSGTDFVICRNSVVSSDANGNTGAAFIRKSTASSASTGIFTRLSAAVQTGYLALYDDTAGGWQLYRAVNGAFTQLGSTVTDTLTLDVSYAVILNASGTGDTVSLNLIVDGTTKATYDDTSASRITSAGYAGVWFNKISTVVIDSITADYSSVLAIGSISLGTITDTSIGVTVGAASGGTSPYTYEWRRLANAADSFTSGTVVGGNSTSLSDTGASKNTLYHYQCRVTDNVSATATSGSIGACLKGKAVIIGFIGDSITNGYGLSAGQKPGDYAVAALKKLPAFRDTTASNNGVNGSKTGDWTTDTSGTNLNTAKAAFASAGVTHVHIMLGANDAATANHVAAATYGSNLSTICSNLVTAGYKVILSYPIYIPAGANSGATDATSVDLAVAYHAQIDALVDNSTIFRGDTEAWKWFVNNLGEYQADLTHPTATGSASLGEFWAGALEKVVKVGASSATVTLTLVDTVLSPQASLTGLKWASFDEITPDLFSAPTDQGSVETTDASGVITISLPNTSKTSGDIVGIVISDSDGTITQSPAPKATYRPAVIG